ncbi:MAG: oligosaccharide flippase family protein [Gaiellaceae bacterium]
MTEPDILDLPAAGHVTIRGGILRLAGYGVGTLVGVAVTIVLLRYLGVRDYGRYATVTSIAAVVAALADLGLTIVGQRDYVLVRDVAERRELLARIVGMRLVFAPLAAAIAVGLAVVAGYDRTMVAGVAIGGGGVVLTLIWQTALIPAAARLRFGRVTAVDVTRDLANAAGLLGLVLAGAGLLAFLTVPTVAALMAVIVAYALVKDASTRPVFSWRTWRPILAEALPLGVAGVIGIVYLRALLIMTSLLTSSAATGLFALSNRILEVLAAATGVAFSVSFPIVARASGDDDEPRLAYALQQLFDVAVFAAVAGVLLLAIGARPIAVLLGGAAYAGAAHVVRIQSFALFGTLLGLVWLPALVAIHRQRARILVSLCGLAMIGVAGGPLIPLFGITGTAVAAVLGEATIAAAGLTALVRARPALRPRFGRALALLAIGSVCSAPAFVPGLPSAWAAVIAVTVFVTVSWSARAMPRDAVDAVLALRRRRG